MDYKLDVKSITFASATSALAVASSSSIRCSVCPLINIIICSENTPFRFYYLLYIIWIENVCVFIEDDHLNTLRSIGNA